MKLKSYKNPQQKKWSQIIASAAGVQPQVTETRLPSILQAVEKDGDSALRSIVKEVLGKTPRSWEVDKRVIAKIQKNLDDEVKARLKALKASLTEMHRDQMSDPVFVRTSDGVQCHRRAMPLRRIGICLGSEAGTRATDLMMLAVPARLAGCESIDVSVAPDADGRYTADVMHAASLCGVDHVYALGVDEAIAAMAVGTATIPRVDKLFVLDERALDVLPASMHPRVCCMSVSSRQRRVMIIADDTVQPAAVASAMVESAATHASAHMMLVCSKGRFAAKIERALDKALQQSPLQPAAMAMLESARLVIFEGDEFRFDALDFANMYVPDTLMLMVHEPAELAEGVYAARTVLCGEGITASECRLCGANLLAATSVAADVAGVVGMDEFMHSVNFLVRD